MSLVWGEDNSHRQRKGPYEDQHGERTDAATNQRTPRMGGYYQKYISIVSIPQVIVATDTAALET